LICCALVLQVANVFAGHSKKHHSAQRTTLADPAEDYYDIRHLKFDLHMVDTNLYIWGNVTTTAQVVVPTMSSYVFELDTFMTVDSAKINGTAVSVSHVGYVNTIALPAPLTSGAIFKAQIFYHGTAAPGGGFFNGMTHAVSPGGTHMAYSVSDPWVALAWWPTKQSVIDKIDSVDMFVTVPAGIKDASNGVLVNVDNTTTPGFSTFHWKTNYPIAYYLVSVAVARYADYKSYWHFTTGPSDSVLIHNFFVDTATFNPLYKANFDSVGMILDYFSNLIVRYPFWQEKYGVAYTSLPGGMEHQTMTTIGVPNTYVIAHELMHQWFGDAVSYRSWHETWLSEAFATYAEALFYDRFWGAAKGRSHRASLLASATSRPCGRIYVTDTTGPDSLFNQATVYNKAQNVMHTLRYMAPQDSLFFKVLRIYQQNHAMGHATGDDFKTLAEGIYGISLDTFFNQWIYGRGYPIYKVSWYQSGTTVFVKLIQTQSCPSYTPHFSTPLQLQLKSPAGDTLIKVYNSLDTQHYQFEWASAMTGMALNPDSWTVCRTTGAITKDPDLVGVTIVADQRIRIFPNPSRSDWKMEGLDEPIALVLTDVAGRILWQGTGDRNGVTIPGSGLATGTYMLKITGSKFTESVKLVRW